VVRNRCARMIGEGRTCSTTHSLHWILLWGIALALGVGLATPAEAVPPSRPTAAAIPPMPLKQALNEFAHREHLQLVYVSSIVDGVRTNGAPEGLSQRSTLHALLQGTGLQSNYLDEHTVTITQAQPYEAVDPQLDPPLASSTSPDPKTLQAVIVTGSLIRRVDTATFSPVITVDRQDIAGTGQLTAGAVLQQLPQVKGIAANTQSSSNGGSSGRAGDSAGDGSAEASLRGLGMNRTLVLIDGQRVVNSDINLIPQNMIQRIEVLPAGASTVYGSDAIGGVVNFIMRKDFKGVEVTADQGISSHGDAQRRGFSLAVGTDGNKGNVVFGFNYNKYDPLLAQRRSYTKYPLDLVDGKVKRTGSAHLGTWGRTQPW